MEAAFVCSTGFSTNSLNLPCIISKDCLVLSDQKNHASMILGIRLAGIKVITYAHGGRYFLHFTFQMWNIILTRVILDFEDLEEKLILNIRANQECHYQLFSKILIATESIYSMDGTIINIEKMIALKRKYKVIEILFIRNYLWVWCEIILTASFLGIFIHWRCSWSWYYRI